MAERRKMATRYSVMQMLLIDRFDDLMAISISITTIYSALSISRVKQLAICSMKTTRAPDTKAHSLTDDASIPSSRDSASLPLQPENG